MNSVLSETALLQYQTMGDALGGCSLEEFSFKVFLHLASVISAWFLILFATAQQDGWYTSCSVLWRHVYKQSKPQKTESCRLFSVLLLIDVYLKKLLYSHRAMNLKQRERLSCLRLHRKLASSVWNLLDRKRMDRKSRCHRLHLPTFWKLTRHWNILHLVWSSTRALSRNKRSVFSVRCLKVLKPWVCKCLTMCFLPTWMVRTSSLQIALQLSHRSRPWNFL